MLEKIACRMETIRSVEAVVGEIEKQAQEHKFRVLHVHDVQKTLAEKGLEREPLKIVELCNSSFAHEALQKEVSVAVFMPCRIVVHAEGNRTIVTLGRPSMIAEMLPGVGLDEMAAQVEKTLMEIIKASV